MDERNRTQQEPDVSNESQAERDPADGTGRRDFVKAATAAGALSLLPSVGTGVAGAQSTDGIPMPWLDVKGNKISDPDGNEIILRGVNIADPKRINVTAPARGKTAEQTIDLLTDASRDWYARVIRIPVQPVDIGEHEPGEGPDPIAFTEADLENTSRPTSTRSSSTAANAGSTRSSTPTATGTSSGTTTRSPKRSRCSGMSSRRGTPISLTHVRGVQRAHRARHVGRSDRGGLGRRERARLEGDYLSFGPYFRFGTELYSDRYHSKV